MKVKPALSVHRSSISEDEREFVEEAISVGRLDGRGRFSEKCRNWLSERLGGRHVLLTNSCTAALQMSALALGIERGDEVIMPSFTAPATANAFALRGAVPVFVDIRPDTLTLEEARIEAAITTRTKAIVVVHYGGIGNGLDEICALAGRHGLWLVEDAAHALLASYEGRPLGTFGALACFSFHATKNVTCGQGGALVVGAGVPVELVEQILLQGTDQLAFERGEVAAYRWQRPGFSYQLAEPLAAILWAQLGKAEAITEARRHHWHAYHRLLQPLREAGRIRFPDLPDGARHNGHIFFVVLADAPERDQVIARMASRGVPAVQHYEPLHASPGAKGRTRQAGSLEVTEAIAPRLLRLPLHAELEGGDLERVVEALTAAVGG